jgi:hypothetical protein
MKIISKLLIVFILNLIISTTIAGEEIKPSDCLITLGEDDSFLSPVTMIAETRQDMIDYCKNCFKDGQFITLYNGTYQEKWRSVEDIPYGGVYLGNGRWSIKYYNNQGYMPKWKI